MDTTKTTENQTPSISDEMKQDADIQGLIVNDETMIVKLHKELKDKHHNVDVEICRKTGQAEIIRDTNNLQKEIMSRISNKPSKYTEFEAECIIINTAREQLKKINI